MFRELRRRGLDGLLFAKLQIDSFQSASRRRAATLASKIAALKSDLISVIGERLPSLKGRVMTFLANVTPKAIYYDAKLRTRISLVAARLAKVSSTILSAAICGVMFVVSPPLLDNLKISEAHLTCAQIIGAALALVLSLSIIPAQRAAELFSNSILRLYARDKVLLGTFLTLVATTGASVFLGTNWLQPRFGPRESIAFQFLLLGISFDALRGFYSRTLVLLVPQAAIALIQKECTAQIVKTSRLIRRLTRTHRFTGADEIGLQQLRALYFSQSSLPNELNAWGTQLEEYAQRFMSRRETATVKSLVSTISIIATAYASNRKDSVVLRPDVNNPFLIEGVSDVSNVLNHLYECICNICADAIAAKNEAAAKHCTRILGSLSLNAMTVNTRGAGGQTVAPLAFSAVFYLGRCVAPAIDAGMVDAVREAVTSLERFLLAETTEIDLRQADTQALEELSKIATAGYRCKQVLWSYEAVSAMLRAGRHELQLYGYDSTRNLTSTLALIATIVPYEVLMEKAGHRVLQILPAYSGAFEAQIPVLLEEAGIKAVRDFAAHARNPFREFFEVSEAVRHHYRELTKVDFQDSQLTKWVVDSLLSTVRVYFRVIHELPRDAPDTSRIEDNAEWLLSWTSGFYPATRPFAKHWAIDAVNGLATIGIAALEQKMEKLARRCAETIAALAQNSAGVKPEPYTLADMHERLETLARAADVLGRNALASEFRGLIVKPANVTTEDWPRYLEARKTRFFQLDEEIDAYRRSARLLRDDPIHALRELIGRREARARQDQPEVQRPNHPE